MARRRRLVDGVGRRSGRLVFSFIIDKKFEYHHVVFLVYCGVTVVVS